MPKKPPTDSEAFVPIDRIIRDPALQLRSLPGDALTDPETVERYREFRESGGEWKDKPIVVTDGDTYWLVAGFHRVEVDEQLSKGSVACEVVNGDYRDALFLALQQNSSHGLPRSHECCKRVVNALLDAPDLVKRIAATLTKGDGGLTLAMAKVCGVSNYTVHERLKSRGLRVSGSKIERIPPDRKPLPLDSNGTEPEIDDENDDEDSSDDTGHMPSGSLAARKGADAAGEAPWTVPQPVGLPENVAISEEVKAIIARLEAYTESPAGEWFFDKVASDKKPFVHDVTGPVGDAASLMGAIDPGYQSAADKKRGIDLAHANAVDPMKAKQRFGRCNWLRELADALLSKKARAA